MEAGACKRASKGSRADLNRDRWIQGPDVNRHTGRSDVGPVWTAIGFQMPTAAPQYPLIGFLGGSGLRLATQTHMRPSRSRGSVHSAPAQGVREPGVASSSLAGTMHRAISAGCCMTGAGALRPPCRQGHAVSSRVASRGLASQAAGPLSSGKQCLTTFQFRRATHLWACATRS